MNMVILDRDGVINEDSADYIRCVDDWTPIPGSLLAIARLNHAGFRVVVASNQSGLGRGLFTIDDLNAIHQRMQSDLAEVGGHVDAVLFCPHSPDEGCDCRKPKPGLLREIGYRFCVDLKGVPVVGDSLRDIQAARAAEAKPVLVRTGNGNGAEKSLSDVRALAVYDDLAAFVDDILAR